MAGFARAVPYCRSDPLATRGNRCRIFDVKVRDLIALLESDGWFHVRTRGSHRQYHHATKAGTETVAGKPGVDIPAGTLGSVLKQAGLKRQEG